MVQPEKANSHRFVTQLVVTGGWDSTQTIKGGCIHLDAAALC